MKITGRRIIMFLGLSLFVFACGKKKDNKKPASGDGIAVTGSIDKDLVGTWGFEMEGFKIEKTFQSSGAVGDKIWENGSLSFHTEGTIKQDNDGDTKRYEEKIAKILVAQGSFEGAQGSLSQKCIYSIEKDSGITLLHFTCDDEYPVGEGENTSTLIKN